VLAQAIKGSGSIDDEKLAAYMHQKRFSTIVGEISFNTRGEWTEPQILMTQFQHVNGNDLAQLDQTGTQLIAYPTRFESGGLIYPFPRNGGVDNEMHRKPASNNTFPSAQTPFLPLFE
jgi:branched-chain amino acid transport system substrate-binding protein